MVRSFLPKFSSKSERRLLALCKNNQDDDLETKKWNENAIKYLVKNLKKQNLGNIIDDLERSIKDECSTTKCIPLPKIPDSRLLVSHRRSLPQVVYCRIWRWPDLQSHHQIKSLDNCQIHQEELSRLNSSKSSSAHQYQSGNNTVNDNNSNNNRPENQHQDNYFHRKDNNGNHFDSSTTSSSQRALSQQIVCVNPYHYERKKTAPLEPVLVPCPRIPPDLSTSFEDSGPTGGGTRAIPNKASISLTGATVRSLLTSDCSLATYNPTALAPLPEQSMPMSQDDESQPSEQPHPQESSEEQDQSQGQLQQQQQQLHQQRQQQPSAQRRQQPQQKSKQQKPQQPQPQQKQQTQQHQTPHQQQQQQPEQQQQQQQQSQQTQYSVPQQTYHQLEPLQTQNYAQEQSQYQPAEDEQQAYQPQSEHDIQPTRHPELPIESQQTVESTPASSSSTVRPPTVEHRPRNTSGQLIAESSVTDFSYQQQPQSQYSQQYGPAYSQTQPQQPLQYSQPQYAPHSYGSTQYSQSVSQQLPPTYTRQTTTTYRLPTSSMQHSPTGGTELAQPYRFRQNKFARMARAMHEHTPHVASYDQHGNIQISYPFQTPQPSQQYQYQQSTVYTSPVAPAGSVNPYQQQLPFTGQAQPIQQAAFPTQPVVSQYATPQPALVPSSPVSASSMHYSAQATYSPVPSEYNEQVMTPGSFYTYQDPGPAPVEYPGTTPAMSVSGIQSHQPYFNPVSGTSQTVSEASQSISTSRRTQRPSSHSVPREEDFILKQYVPPKGIPAGRPGPAPKPLETQQGFMHSNPLPEQTSPVASTSQSAQQGETVMSSQTLEVIIKEVPYNEGKKWCSISYHEYDHRIGEKFQPDSYTVHVDGYTSPMCSDRFCLGNMSNINRANTTEWVRRRIGKGVKLSYVDGEVYVECLSDSSVFVSSPLMGLEEGLEHEKIYKISPTYHEKVFSNSTFSKFLSEAVNKGFETVYRLTQMCTFRVSFVKGWGQCYKRQTILNTPCWFEVQLNGPLQWIDKVLRTLKPPQRCGSTS